VEEEHLLMEQQMSDKGADWGRMKVRRIVQFVNTD
jgi:hypothetical protein